MEEVEKSCILLTGATGYIGKQLLVKLIADGFSVICLGGCPKEFKSKTQQLKWRLGDEVKTPRFYRVKTVIHLAHDWKTRPTDHEDEINYKGTKKLLKWSRKHQVNRFIFVSSISAKETSLNKYGRIKAKIEKLMINSNEISVRVGLVYGGPNEGMWLQLLNLTKAAPIIPMVKPETHVQPIFSEDLICSLISIIKRKNINDKIIGLASANPVEFGVFLKKIAKIKHRKNIFIFPISLKVALFSIKFLNLIFLKEKFDKERVLGLAGITVYNTHKDIKTYSFKFRTLNNGLDKSV